MYVIKFKNKTGFYLNKIIELFKIEKSDFMEWNKLNSDKVIADKEYIIKKNKDSFDFELHTVKKGDILNDISNEYQVSINDVEICNGIENTEQIQPNQKLIIITKK